MYKISDYLRNGVLYLNNTNKGIYTLEQTDSLTFRQKPHAFCGVPPEKVFTHKNVTTELFGRNKFVPLMQNNQIVTQGYYGAIRSFVDAVEEIEKHHKAQLAYSFDFALQNEFSLEENI